MKLIIGLLFCAMTSVYADTMNIPCFEGTIYNYSKIIPTKLALNWSCRMQDGMGYSSCGSGALMAKVSVVGKTLRYQFEGLKNRELDRTSHHFVSLSLESNDQKIFLWEGFVGNNDFGTQDLINKNKNISVYVFKKKKLKLQTKDGTSFIQWLGDQSTKDIRYEANISLPGQPAILNISKFLTDNPLRLQSGAYVNPENFNLDTRVVTMVGNMGEKPNFQTSVSLVRVNTDLCVGVCDSFITWKSTDTYNGEYPSVLDLMVD